MNYEEIWAKVLEPVIGHSDPSVTSEEIQDGVGLHFRVKTSFAHRPGSGFLGMSLTREFVDDPSFPVFLEDRLRYDLAKMCPYARQFLEEKNGTVG